MRDADLADGSGARAGLRYTPTTCFETFPFPEPTPEERERVGDAARRLADLAKRTLTNLSNQRPTWLASAYADLDLAVFDRYRWPTVDEDEILLTRLLSLNSTRVNIGIGIPRNRGRRA